MPILGCIKSFVNGDTGKDRVSILGRIAPRSWEGSRLDPGKDRASILGKDRTSILGVCGGHYGSGGV
ncbi:MAG: hypothetical protein LBP88_04395 [Treponema sp.]|nr:hypothetical protein [Treponema sp.]